MNASAGAKVITAHLFALSTNPDPPPRGRALEGLPITAARDLLMITASPVDARRRRRAHLSPGCSGNRFRITFWRSLFAAVFVGGIWRSCGAVLPGH
jgi:hypothetical protein